MLEPSQSPVYFYSSSAWGNVTKVAVKVTHCKRKWWQMAQRVTEALVTERHFSEKHER